MLLLGLGWSHRDQAITIQFDNQSQVDVTILVDRRAWATVGAHDAETIGDIRSYWEEERLIEVVEQRTGRLLLSVTVDRNELRRMDNRVVIPSL